MRCMQIHTLKGQTKSQDIPANVAECALKCLPILEGMQQNKTTKEMCRNHSSLVF